MYSSVADFNMIGVKAEQNMLLCVACFEKAEEDEKKKTWCSTICLRSTDLEPCILVVQVSDFAAA